MGRGNSTVKGSIPGYATHPADQLLTSKRLTGFPDGIVPVVTPNRLLHQAAKPKGWLRQTVSLCPHLMNLFNTY
ncbi:hypothetical protein JZ751_029656, partial [Albula glossodonta]